MLWLSRNSLESSGELRDTPREEAPFTERGILAHSRSQHPNYLKLVRPQLIDVGPSPWQRLVPKAEFQQQLIPPGEQHFTSLIPEFQVLL